MSVAGKAQLVTEDGNEMMIGIPFVRLITLILLVLLPFSSVLAGPLHDAAENGRLGEVKRLIEEGIDVNERTKGGLTPLHNAALGGHTALAELHINNGAEVNATNIHGFTPLRYAVRAGNKMVADMLRKHGAE